MIQVEPHDVEGVLGYSSVDPCLLLIYPDQRELERLKLCQTAIRKSSLLLSLVPIHRVKVVKGAFLTQVVERVRVDLFEPFQGGPDLIRRAAG